MHFIETRLWFRLILKPPSSKPLCNKIIENNKKIVNLRQIVPGTYQGRRRFLGGNKKVPGI